MKDILVLIGIIIFCSAPIILSIMYYVWIKNGKVLADDVEEQVK